MSDTRFQDFIKSNNIKNLGWRSVFSDGILSIIAHEAPRNLGRFLKESEVIWNNDQLTEALGEASKAKVRINACNLHFHQMYVSPDREGWNTLIDYPGLKELNVTEECRGYRGGAYKVKFPFLEAVTSNKSSVTSLRMNIAPDGQTNHGMDCEDVVSITQQISNSGRNNFTDFHFRFNIINLASGNPERFPCTVAANNMLPFLERNKGLVSFSFVNTHLESELKKSPKSVYFKEELEEISSTLEPSLLTLKNLAEAEPATDKVKQHCHDNVEKAQKLRQIIYGLGNNPSSWCDPQNIQEISERLPLILQPPGGNSYLQEPAREIFLEGLRRVEAQASEHNIPFTLPDCPMKELYEKQPGKKVEASVGTVALTDAPTPLAVRR